LVATNTNSESVVASGKEREKIACVRDAEKTRGVRIRGTQKKTGVLNMTLKGETIKAKKLIDKATEFSEKENAERNAEVYVMFAGIGAECGVEIATVAKQIHPDAMFIFPLYRGCIVIPKQEYTGSLTAILYHDPQWMGADEITVDNLPGFKNTLEIHGQRSGQDYVLNTEELAQSEFIIRKFMNDIESEAGWSYVKEKDPKATGMCIAKDVPKSELRKRINKVFWNRVEKYLYMFKTGKMGEE